MQNNKYPVLSDNTFTLLYKEIKINYNLINEKENIYNGEMNNLKEWEVLMNK